ncbi:MAG: homoserine kinase [Dehalococcoidia bacterium]|nr:homoserine kinase [Dehalococcoidia bacterium]
MPAQKITVRAPATTANLGPGFDCLGMALDLWVEVVVTASEEPLPPGRAPLGGMTVQAAQRLFSHLGKQPPAGLSVEWTQRIPVARGLGASAVARAAGLLAANALLGEPLGREEILALGSELEGHADNMAPVLFGGFQVLAYSPSPGWQEEPALVGRGTGVPPAFRLQQEIQRAEEPYEQEVARARGAGVAHLKLDLPDGLRAVLFVPHFEMPTEEGRSLLPNRVSRADAVHNIGRAALLVGALSTGKLELLDVATQDRLHQPVRARLFRPMTAIFRAAWEAGALCAFLSGGGSTVLALTTGHERQIGRAMSATARTHGIKGRTVVTAPSERGATVTVLERRVTLQDMGDFYRRSFPRVFAYAYGWLGDSDVVEDVVTQTFVTTLRNAALLPSRDALETSLFTVARALVHDKLANRSTARRARAEVSQRMDGLFSSESLTPKERQDIRMIETYLRRLPRLMQDAIRLKFDAELTNAQIATVLGMTATTLRVTIDQALHRLRGHIDERAGASGYGRGSGRRGRNRPYDRDQA